jgi:hypothetical protein
MLYNKVKKFQPGKGFNTRIDKVIYTAEDRANSDFFRDNMLEGTLGNCKGDACLLYTKGLGYIPGVKTIGDIENARGLLTTSTQPTPEQIEKYPYLKGDYKGSVDSWDLAGVYADSGKTFYNILDENRNENFDLDTPVGTFYLWGPDQDMHPYGYSKAKGYKNSNHTMIKVGWDKDTGESILMDAYDKKLYTLSEAREVWKKYNLQTVIAPEENLNLNREFFQKFFDEQNKSYDFEVQNPYDKIKKSVGFEKAVNNSSEGEKYLTHDLGNFTLALVQHANNLAKDLNLDPDKYKQMVNFLTATAMTETKGGKSLKGIKGYASELVGSSIGMTQINPDNIFNDPRLASIADKYGIRSRSDLKDPYKAGLASMIYLSQLDKSSKSLYNRGNENPRVIKSKEAPGMWSSPKQFFSRDLRGSSFQKPDETFDGYYMLPNGKRVFLNYDVDDQYKTALLRKEVEKYYPNQGNLYSVKNGEVYRQAEGNVELSPEERWATAWRSPGVLLRGDATKNKYVNKTMYNLDNYIRSTAGKSIPQTAIFKKGGLLYKKGNTIKIDPEKKGTFKAQATKMGMDVQEAASHILANKNKYSSKMVKKANFAKNFAK